MMHGQMRTLLLGEAIADLTSPTPGAFSARVGGAAATVAQAAAAHGAQVALAAAAGDDLWGRWLRDELAAAGVATDHLVLDPARQTGVAFRVGDAVELYGDPSLPHGDPPQLDALVITSSTIATDDERAITLLARDHAVKSKVPVVAVADLRSYRWQTPAMWASEARELARDAYLFVADAEEARLLTGEEQPAAAADGLVAMGATYAVVLAPRGAIVRGGGLRRAAATPGPVPPGPGPVAALTGVVLARLAGTEFYGAAIAAALADGARAAHGWAGPA